MSQEVQYDNPKFLQNENLIKLDKNIFLYKNFLNTDLENKCLTKLNSFTEKEWSQHGNYEMGDQPEEAYAADKVSPPIPDVGWINDSVLDFFAPEYWNIGFNFMGRLKVNDKLNVHAINELDADGNKMFNVDYFAAVFLGEFSGGEILFVNKGICVDVERRDLLIFSADPEYAFQVKELRSGIRYSSNNLIFKNPTWVII